MSAQTPEDCDRLLAEHLNAGQIDAIVGLYEPNACFVQQDRQVLTGSAAIRQSFVEFAAMKPTLRSNVTKVVRVGNDLAVLYNDWTMSVTGPDGKPVEMAGKALEVVRRQADGSWRFAADDPFARS